MTEDKNKKDEDRDDIVELLKTIVIAGVIALGVRGFFFEPFNIPSGSMFPSLLVGDYLFVEKYAYGYSRYSFPFGVVPIAGRVMEKQPARGDVAVFRLPGDTRVDYIKRIVGLPGDRIQVKGGILHINGEAVTREYIGPEGMAEDNRTLTYRKYIETLPNGVKHYIYEISDVESVDDTPEYTVPAGHYFAMGDNRDRSQDSRFQAEVGFIPAANLVGRAWFLFFSTEGTGDKCVYDGMLAAVRAVGCKLVEWPTAVRYGRMFRVVHDL